MIYYILLIGYFKANYNFFNYKKLNKEEKERSLFLFLDKTETLTLFWNDAFDEFKILMSGASPLHRKYKYLRKNCKSFS